MTLPLVVMQIELPLKLIWPRLATLPSGIASWEPRLDRVVSVVVRDDSVPVPLVAVDLRPGPCTLDCLEAVAEESALTSERLTSKSS